MSGDCGSPEAAAEGLKSDTGVLLGKGAYDHGVSATAALGRRRSPVCCAAKCAARFARLDHALLVEGLKVPDHLRNQPDKLPRNVSDILLAELALWLPSKAWRAECRLELRPAKLLLPER